jgi:hypothetical protein
VLVTSLNDQPLAHSRRILVQAMTEEKHFGWKVVGGKIASVGGLPVLVRNIDATVTLKEGARYVVETLDELSFAFRHPLDPLTSMRGWRT